MRLQSRQQTLRKNSADQAAPCATTSRDSPEGLVCAQLGQSLNVMKHIDAAIVLSQDSAAEVPRTEARRGRGFDDVKRTQAQYVVSLGDSGPTARVEQRSTRRDVSLPFPLHVHHP